MADTTYDAWFQPIDARLGGAHWALLGVLGVLLQWHLLFMPLGLDQGIYATTAMKMLEGKALYRETWDMKSPGIFFLYLLPMLGGGGKTWLIHALHLVLHTLAAGALLRAGSMMVGRAYGWSAAALYFLFVATFSTPITMGQPDDWLLPFLLWGFLHLYRAADPAAARRSALGRAALAGVLMGFALVLRSTMLFAVALAPLVWVAWFVASGAPDAAGVARPAMRRLVECLLAYVAGGMAMGLTVLAYFVATGSLVDLYHCQFVWIRNYVTTELDGKPLTVWWAVRFSIRRWFEFFQHDLVFVLWPAYAGVGYLAWRRMAGWRPLRPLVAWAITFALSSTSYWVQLKFFNYHHWFVAPFVALALAVPAMLLVRAAVALVAPSSRRTGWAMWATRLALVAMVWGAWAAMANSPTTLKHLFYRQTRCVRWLRGVLGDRRYHTAHKFAYFYFPYEDELLVRTISERNRRNGPPRVFIYGFRPQVYHGLGISGPSKFAYNLPLRAKWSPPEWNDNLRGEVMATPPDFVLLGYNDYFPWVTGNRLTSAQSMPDWLRTMLEEEFDLVWEMSNFNLYERHAEDYTPARFRSLRPAAYYDEPGEVPHEVLPEDGEEEADGPELVGAGPRRQAK